MYLKEWSIVITVQPEAELGIRVTLLCPACSMEYVQKVGTRKLTPEFAKHRHGKDDFWIFVSKHHDCPKCGTTGRVPLRFKERFDFQLDRSMSTDWLATTKDRLHLVEGVGQGTDPAPIDNDFQYVSWVASSDTPKGEEILGPFRLD